MTSTTSELAQQRLSATPELRFPEFRDAPSWDGKELSSIADPVSERADNEGQHNILTLSGEHGLVLQSEYFGKQIAGTSSERYLRIQRDDFVYNDRTTKASAYGTIKRLKHHPHGIVSPIYKCFRFKGGELPSFWEWYFESGAHEAQLRSLANEGARAGRFNVSIDRFLSTIAFSPDPQSSEQAKIAECLSTLDELIDAERQKLDALKTHRQGFMRHLFPLDGEALPRFRFPEFQDGPHWRKGTLGELFETASGGTPSRSEKAYWGGSIPWVTTALVDFRVIHDAEEFITPEGLANSSAKLFPKGTVLIAMYGQGKTRGQVALLGIEAATNQACAAIFPRDEVDPYFLFLSLSGRYEEIREMSNSGGQENLSQGLIREIPFAFPADRAEQHRISRCLSLLDDLTGAQSEKLEALKIHREGLMQKLFPSNSEAFE